MAEERDGGVQWWYGHPVWRRGVHRGLMLLVLGVGLVWFTGSAWEWAAQGPDRDWGSMVGRAFWLIFMAGVCRSFVMGVAIDGDDLLVRRIWPGSPERIPLRRLRAWLVVDPLAAHLYLKGPGLIPLHLWCVCWFGRARCPGWEEVVTAVRDLLKPAGRWWE
jgi:hypothetical protein